MASGDILAIAIGIVCLVICLTTLKFTSRVLMGIVLSFIVLSCLGSLSQYARFNELTHDVFKSGVVLPFVRQKASHVLYQIRSSDQQKASGCSSSDSPVRDLF